MLRWRAEHQPEARAYTFLVDGESVEATLTYADLDRKARAVGAYLQARGAVGERVVLVCPPGLEYTAAYWGCLYAGAIAVPSYPPRLTRTTDALLAIIRDSGASIALTTAQTVEAVSRDLARAPDLAHLTLTTVEALTEEATAERRHDASDWRHPGVGRESLAFLQYTSGSTGTPKGVMVSHGNLIANMTAAWDVVAMRPDSRPLSWLPPYHDMGLISGVIHPIFVGLNGLLMTPAAFIQRPARWMKAISHYGVTHTGGPPFAYDYCLRKIAPEQLAGVDLSTWTTAYVGAEPIRVATLRQFAERFGPYGLRSSALYPCYGMAEATLMVSGGPHISTPVALEVEPAALERGTVQPAQGDAARPLAGCGQPLDDTTVVIADPERLTGCPAGQVGEIWVSSPAVALGYWNQPEVSAATFRAHRSDTGDGPYLRTGDLGFLHDGQVYVTGRHKDLIILKGKNHYPQDIEATVERSHPALRPAGVAAFSVDDAQGEQLVVVQEIEAAYARRLDADAVTGAIRAAVAQTHDAPLAAVALVRPGSILKTSSGKIRRRACRQAFLDGTLSTVAVWSQPGFDPVRMAASPDGKSDTTTSDLTDLDDTSEPQPSTEEIGRWLVERVAAALQVGPGAIDVREPFVRYGLTSVEAVGLSGELEAWLGRRLPPTVAYDYPSVEALARRLGPEWTEEAPEPLAPPPAADEPIAIVGVGCRLPGADGPDALWRLLHDGVDAISEVPADRWSVEDLHDPDADAPGKIVARTGGFLDRVDGFDADFFRIAHREATRMDPQQRLLLEVCWEALEDAGQVVDRLAGSQTGVFMGICSSDYARLHIGSGAVDEIDAYSGTGVASSIAVGRISYLLGLNGPNLAVDTSCSSSLVAVHLACQSLRGGESSLALAGGVNLILAPETSLFLTKAHALAPDGRCKTFSAAADGYGRGEGCGVVVLKRLSDARADGDRVLAIIRGSAVNHDGHTNGLTAPNGPAQEAVVRAALARAGVAPADVTYIEAHGTGTPLGDPIEVQALGAVLGAGRPAGRPVALGSIKTNIGHLEGAAGVAGLLKVVASLDHGQIPPHLHLERPSPYIPWAELPFEAPTRLTPWTGVEGRRIAGVSAFGFSGTNAHVVVEGDGSKDGRRASASSAEPLVLPISARTPAALRAFADAYRTYLGPAGSSDALEDIAYTACLRRAHHPCRLAVVGATREELVRALDAYLRGEQHPGLHVGAEVGQAGTVVTQTPHALAASYVRGEHVLWTTLFPDGGRCVRLPRYPWQRERFWIDSRPTEARRDAPPPEPAVETTALPDLDLVAFLTDAVAQSLGRPATRIDADQPLTDLGLDSLMAMDLRNSVLRRLGVQLPLTVFLQGPSIRDLSDVLVGLQQGRASEAGPAGALDVRPGEPAGDDGGLLPLSSGQQALWLTQKLAPSSTAYHILFASRLTGPLDAAAMETAVHQLVARHESLRTGYLLAEDGRPFQRIDPTGHAAFAVLPADSLSDSELRARIAADADTAFDLEQGPLLRVTVYRRGPNGYVLALVVHHIAVDFWSVEVLVGELRALYEAASLRQPAVLPEPTPYSAFVRWQASLLAGPDGARLWAYWRRKLSGDLPVLSLPTDRPRPRVQTSRGALHDFTLSADLTVRLHRMARAEGATLYATLLAAYAAVLGRHTGQQDILIGSPMAGRGQADLARTVGYLVNFLPLRLDLTGGPSLRDLVRQARDTLLEALDHQDFPFSLLVERLQPTRDPGITPLVQTLFIWYRSGLLEGAPGDADTPGLELLTWEQRGAPYDLMLLMSEVRGQLVGRLQYNADLFDADTMARLATHLGRLLESALADADRPVAEARMLTGAERVQQLYGWNDTAAPYSSDACLPDLFEAQAARTPDAPAVIHGSDRVTYRELNRRANGIARRLRALGVGRDILAGICLRRTPTLVAAILGVLKAGGAYVPLDPAYPPARVATMLDDARPAVVLAEQATVGALDGEAGGAACLLLDDLGPDSDADEANPSRHGSPDDLAYVIYTSGSSGQPKGVMVPHRGPVALAAWAHEQVGAELLRGTLASTSVCFDLSVFELFAPLTVGGAVILVDSILHLPTAPAADRVTLVNTVPSALGALLRDYRLPASVRAVALAGETLPNALAQAAYQQPGVEAVYNLYGPTEDSVYSTWALIERGANHEPTIGRPLPNRRAYILDDARQPVPLGVPGELYLGGVGVARGYLQQPTLTAERFLTDPFADDPDGRMYRVGDRARFRADGAIELLGRVDRQLKVRGFRIEPDEIEAALLRHPSVEQAAVIARPDHQGVAQLVGYVVARRNAIEETRDAEPPTISELRRFLARTLPDYMTPSALVWLDELPRTPSGKIDRRALPEPSGNRPSLDVTYEPPRTVAEATLAAIWSEVLQVERVGIHDSFFDLGGASFASIAVAARANAEGIPLTADLLFAYPTIAALSELAAQPGAPGADTSTPTDRPADGSAGHDNAARALEAAPASSDDEPHAAVGAAVARGHGR
ncbi:MAG: amino acid adenylation domain-containing protein [Chloroflexi bacterium]|nr:amino acid adenylation domain-containing protein [Chloroflexota bacterium]